MSAAIPETAEVADEAKHSTTAKTVSYHKNIILLIGNPNVGKTSIFNQLARNYAITANYPFTTVEINRDTIRIHGKQFELIDAPGIYRLDYPSEEGQLTREIIFNQHPEIIIQVIEASNLEQSLVLTAQLLELGTPLIVALNMVDETVKHGIRINSRLLSEQLGVPVIETIATEGKGIDNIKKVISKLTPPNSTLKYPALIENLYQQTMRLFPPKNKPPHPIITLLALDDGFAWRWIEANYGRDIARRVRDHFNAFLDKHVVNLSIAILNNQTNWVRGIVDRVVTRRGDIASLGIQKFGELARHNIFGWFILIAVIFLTYLIVGKFGAIFLVNALDQSVFQPLTQLIDNAASIPFLKRLLVGDYGIFTTGLFNAIGTVLPIIALFFLVLNLLEDVGYLTNLIILTNRLFKKVGLSGKSILPIVLGFGCKTMATLSTRILDSKKEKYIAIFLIGLAIPCSSQLSVNMAVLSMQPITAFIIVIAILTLIELVAGLILNRMLPDDRGTDFIIEIPPIRPPDIKLLIKKTYYRTLWFLKEAVPLFILGALVLFILSETGGMAILQSALRPIVVTFLNLPINFSEALVMSLARSEAGAVLIMNMAKQGQLTTNQVIVAVVVITLFIPCISNVMAMIKELRPRKALTMVLTITIAAFLIGGLINYILNL